MYLSLQMDGVIPFGIAIMMLNNEHWQGEEFLYGETQLRGLEKGRKKTK